MSSKSSHFLDYIHRMGNPSIVTWVRNYDTLHLSPRVKSLTYSRETSHLAASQGHGPSSDQTYHSQCSTASFWDICTQRPTYHLTSSNTSRSEGSPTQRSHHISESHRPPSPTFRSTITATQCWGRRSPPFHRRRYNCQGKW